MVVAYFVVAGVEAFDYFGGDVEGGIEVNASRFEEDCIVAFSFVVGVDEGCDGIVELLLLTGQLLLG